MQIFRVYHNLNNSNHSVSDFILFLLSACRLMTPKPVMRLDFKKNLWDIYKVMKVVHRNWFS